MTSARRHSQNQIPLVYVRLGNTPPTRPVWRPNCLAQFRASSGTTELQTPIRVAGKLWLDPSPSSGLKREATSFTERSARQRIAPQVKRERAYTPRA